MIRFFFSFPQSIRVFFTLFYLGIVVLLSMLPAKDLPHWQPFQDFDKLVHACMYFGLTTLACWTLHAEEHRQRILVVVLYAIVWGMLMEIAQLEMNHGRSFDLKDELFNSIGAVVGAGLFAILGRGHGAWRK